MLPSGSSVRATLRRNRIQSLIENQQDSASRRRMAVSILSLRDGEKHAYLALIVPGLRHPMVHPDILPFLGMRWLELPPGHFWEPFMSPIGIIDPIRFTRLSLEHKPRQIGFMCENFLVLPDEAPKRDIDIYISEEFLTNHMSAGPPYNPGGNGHEYDPVSRQIPTGISSPAPGPDAANSSSHVFSQLQSQQLSAAGWHPYYQYPAPEPQPPQRSVFPDEPNRGHSGLMWNANPNHDGDNYVYDVTGGQSFADPDDWMPLPHQGDLEDQHQ